MINSNKTQKLFTILSLFASIGLLASFLQIIDKIKILENPQTVLACNINPIFSCSSLLNVWQSSVFGFPNSLMCIIFFSSLLTLGLIGLSGVSITKKVKVVALYASIFFVGFGFWYFWQSIFVIGGICVYCIFCYTSVLVITSSILRLISNTKSASDNRSQKYINFITTNSFDVLAIIVIALILIFSSIISFGF